MKSYLLSPNHPVTKPRRLKHLFLTFLSIALIASADNTFAQDATSISSGDYNIGANWDIGSVPNDLNGTAHVANGTTMTITANVPDMNKLFVGTLGTTGQIDHSAGTVNLTNGLGTLADPADNAWFFVGQGSDTGVYNQSGTANLSALRGGIGQSDGSDGTYNLSGDATASFDFLHIAQGTNLATGNVTVADNAALTANNVQIGNIGNGTLTQSGGSVTVNVWSVVGQAAGSNGTYNMDGGSYTVANEFVVGRENGAMGTVNQTDGSVTAGAWVGVGADAGSTGTYNISGGSLTATGGANPDVNVGDGGTGTLHQTGGAVAADNWVAVGKNGGSVGEYNISGAGSTLTAGNDLRVGHEGTGTVNQNGGTVTANAWTVVGGNTGNGTYNLNSGTLNANARLVVAEAPSATGVLNVNGGMLNTVDNLVIGRDGAGSMLQTGGVVNTQFLDVGGDPGTGGVNPGSAISVTSGTINAANDIRIGLNPNAGTPFNVGMNVSGDADINVTGNLEVSIDGNAHFLISGSNASIDIGGNLDANSASVAQLIWGTDANGVSTINVGGDVDVTGAELLLQMVDGDPGTGLETVSQAVPADLLLIDNQGSNPVTGLLTYNPVFGTLKELSEGELLVDDGVLGLLDGLQYSITYLGGDGNDVVLELVPEPASMMMLGLGVALFGAIRRRS